MQAMKSAGWSVLIEFGSACWQPPCGPRPSCWFCSPASSCLAPFRLRRKEGQNGHHHPGAAADDGRAGRAGSVTNLLVVTWLLALVLMLGLFRYHVTSPLDLSF